MEEIIQLRKEGSERTIEKENLLKNKISEEQINQMMMELENQKETLKKINENKIKRKEKEHLLEIIKEKNKQVQMFEESNKELKNRVGRINTRKMELEKTINEKKETEKNHEQAKEKEKQILEQEKLLHMEKASLSKEMELMTKQEKQINEELEKQKKFGEEEKRIRKTKDWLENNFTELTAVIEKHVMTQIHREFDTLFRQWFSTLMEDENLSIRLDENFKPIVMQNSYETEIENLSGGEKTAAALAYRLALNKVINQMIETIQTKDTIILDEPTDGFSSEQLDKVRNVLEELNLKQVIIVSHENKVESFVDNIIRIGKHEHVSKVIN